MNYQQIDLDLCLDDFLSRMKGSWIVYMNMSSETTSKCIEIALVNHISKLGPKPAMVLVP